MAGAGKRRVKAERQGGKVVTDNSALPDTSITASASGTQPPGSFDGPSDEQSTRGDPSHGFGPSLGYDPARDNSGNKLVVPSRLELPSAAYQHYNFPTKLPERPGLNTQGKEVQVRVNQFKVTHWPQKVVYQYDVHIGSGDEKRGLIQGIWNSRKLQRDLQSLDRMWLFDGNKIAWCLTKASVDLRQTVDMDEEKGRTPKPGRDNKFKVRVSLVSQVHMGVISGYLEKKMAFDNTVLQAINFLDHCMRQMPSQYYTQVKRSFFHHGNERHGLSDPGYVEAMKGVYSSMRLCQMSGSFGLSTGLAVNVDVANGTFWTGQILHQAVRNLCDLRRRGNFSYLELRNVLRPTKMENGEWTRSDVFKHLRKMTKLKFMVKHRGKVAETKVYTIKDFCFDQKWGEAGGCARMVTFALKNKKNPDAEPEIITVENYFKKQYKIDLEYWYLPLVKTERDGTFPLEVCHLLENQPFKYKLDSDQTANMIKFAVTRPKQRMKAVEFGVDMLKWHEDPYLKHYGVKIEPKMTLTKARLLQNPEVHFQGSKLNPGTTGRWDLRGKKFFTANTEPLKSWGICILGEAIDIPSLENFVKVLVQIYRGHGGNFAKGSERPFIMACPKNTSNLGDVSQQLWKSTGDKFTMKPQILMFILPDRNTVTYERLKRNMECRFGIVSQMMWGKHVQKAQPQYCSNVCMKINAKLGGSTSRVGIKPPVNPNGQSEFFNGPTMIIGADVSHPSPGSPQGSMAALTVSMDRHAARYAAAVQTNGHRVEMITTSNIRTMMMPLFEHWVKTVGGGKTPGHIFYFRDGVSEGQYEHVLQQELEDMKKVIKEQYPSAMPKFTVTVASKRHHLRFFPQDGDMQAGDRNGNALPGTLVEQDITHPFEYDFYLCSHSAIQGTARPTHYHVLFDDSGIPVNIFQKMIYQHCYQYMRSTTPVSLHPAVYYAHIASLRARSHENSPASAPPRGGAKFVEQQQDAAIHHSHVYRPQPSVKSSMDMHTEVLPLTAFAVAATDDLKQKIITSMWYI